MTKKPDDKAPERNNHATRFKKGSSGNPNGRPRGSKNFSTVLKAELNKKVGVVEGGRQKTLRKVEVIATRLVNKSAEGDLKAIPVVLKQMQSIDEQTEKVEQVAFSPKDRDVLQEIYDRMKIYKGDNDT